jgi:hypothetical protein
MDVEAVRGWVPGHRLAAEGLLWCIVSITFLATGFRWIADISTPVTAARWVGPTGIVIGGFSGFIFHYRRNLRRPNGTWIHSIGLANAITLLRALLLAGVAGFVLLDGNGVLTWLPALGYGQSSSSIASTGQSPGQSVSKLASASGSIGRWIRLGFWLPHSSPWPGVCFRCGISPSRLPDTGILVVVLSGVGGVGKSGRSRQVGSGDRYRDSRWGSSPSH